jgi:NNP family nitrate/nitrite transporter-like MFS transporter
MLQRNGSSRVLALSTFAFTLMFAVWLMFGVLGIPIQEEFGISDSQLAWLSSVAILNGSIWRLLLGVLADRVGGKKVTVVMLLVTSIPAYLLAHLELTYTWLLVLAFFVGFAGNLFSVGIAWNSHWFDRSRQGFALGVFGAGNVGASATKFIGPAVIAGTIGGSYLGGIIPGGWRFVPALYSVLLILTAIAIQFFTPSDTENLQASRSLSQMFAPLKYLQVWRFSFYYVVVFGAYVALASWMPKYYVSVYGLDLHDAALLTALFIFPASLLRPLGGYVSDKIGARHLMYGTFFTMLIALLFLAAPFGYIVLNTPEGPKNVLPYYLGVMPFTALLFIVGCSMGIGKAAVFKHIPEYFPNDVGAVGGLVGTLGALGGFLLPPLFVYVREWTGLPQSTFIVLFLLTFAATLWMHVAIIKMLNLASPQLKQHIDHRDPQLNGA